MNKKLPYLLISCLFTATAISQEVSSGPPKNVLLICVDDLRPELRSFGAQHIHSPNIDKLAAEGRAFCRHYVNAPSCGPSRYSMLTSLYPTSVRGNEHLAHRARQLSKDPGSVPPSMPEWFRKHGYNTVSVGKVSHHPGGRLGKSWADESAPELPNAWDKHLMPVNEWKTPQAAMHGYAHGRKRTKGKEDFIYESVAGEDTIYPDGIITKEGLLQLEELALATNSNAKIPAKEEIESGKPFFLAIGLIKPHLPFAAPKKYLDLYDRVEFPPIANNAKPRGITTWQPSVEFMGYNRWGKDPRSDQEFAEKVRRHYAACVSYIDKSVGDILIKLKETGLDKNTVVILWGDHGWHLGEQGVWGKHTLFEESLRAPLIIVDSSVTDAGVMSNAVVDTLDIFPTLCELTGLETPDFVKGVSLQPILKNPKASGHNAIAYHIGNKTIRTDRYRLTLHKNGYTELYDHATPEKEMLNIAKERPKLVEELKKLLITHP